MYLQADLQSLLVAIKLLQSITLPANLRGMLDMDSVTSIISWRVRTLRDEEGIGIRVQCDYDSVVVGGSDVPCG